MTTDGNHQQGPEPSVSVVIPTLNSTNTLEWCLESVKKQRYVGEVEVIVADGGSEDGTVEVARCYGCTVVDNPRRTGEAGKARGLKEASGQVVALIDSDNILPDPNWLSMMTSPFSDPLVVGTEPIEYEYRREDPLLTRYCALMGMNDPLCYFLGNYDRTCVLSGKWTGLDVDWRDRGEYLEVRLERDRMPTIGANGFLVRRDLLEQLGIGDYLFDIDLLHDLVRTGHDRFAKVKTGIVHLYGRGLGTFARKQLRRVRDFRYYQARGMRSYPWSRQEKAGLVRFVVYCLLVVPLIAQSLIGYRKRPDPAWALHTPACLITLVVYTWGYIEGAIRPREQKRTRWGQ
ncbi:MAG: glycosyltransferase family 2 protein [Actinomycetia bacterium]|nr:glycosyltransferase family 2 protein [Actinomycetes bacterium]